MINSCDVPSNICFDVMDAKTKTKTDEFSEEVKTAFCIFMLKKPSVLVVEGFPNYSEHIPAAALFSHSFLWDQGPGPGLPEVWSMGLDVSITTIC